MHAHGALRQTVARHHNETPHIIATHRMATDPKRFEHVKHRKRKGVHD